MGRIAVWLLLCAAAAAAADPLFQRAQAKIGLIEDDLAAPGSRIWITVEELNAYARVAAVEAVPQGLREPRLALGRGAASGSALVDFLKIRELQGPPPSPLLGWFLAGERRVSASARIETARGMATVHLQEVAVNGVAARGAPLEFLIENFLLPFYPDAKIGRPFQLKHNVERFEISPQGVTVFIAGPARK